MQIIWLACTSIAVFAWTRMLYFASWVDSLCDVGVALMLEIAEGRFCD